MYEATAPNFDGSQLCAQTDPELFFPEMPEIPVTLSEKDKRRLRKIYNKQLKEDEATAKLLCNSCNFSKECLDYALHTDVQGIWGGTNVKERKEMRQALKILPPKPLSLHIKDLLK
jgi:hypothetical protein